jgi:hypothetical protein
MNGEETFGLVYDMKSNFYSQNINFQRAAVNLKTIDQVILDCIKEIKTKEHKTLADIIKNAENFIQSDIVYSRFELKSVLTYIIEGKGIFACLLGGRNTGKSLVLGDLQKCNPDKVFLIDLRMDSSILRGLLSNLKVKMKEQHYNIVLSDPTSFTEVIDNLANNLPPPITLIIDEANLAFMIDESTSITEIDEAKETLSIFTALTKQLNKVFKTFYF